MDFAKQFKKLSQDIQEYAVKFDDFAKTQKDAWDEAVEREVNAYFRGPRATLLAILRKAINWEASDLAEQIDIKEIRFKRTFSGRLGWDIELAN